MHANVRPGRVRHALRSYRSWAETLTAFGVIAVAMSFYWLPQDLKSLGVQASLGLTLMISAYVASNNLRSTRRHHVAVQLSNAAMHVGNSDPTIQMAGIYLLSSLRTDRNADQELRRMRSDCSSLYATAHRISPSSSIVNWPVRGPARVTA